MRLRFTSILSRIVWLHVLALAVITFMMSSAAYLLLELTVNNLEERTLRDRAEVVSRYLSSGAGGWKLDLPADLEASYRRGYAGFAVSVTDESGAVVYSSLAGGSALLPPGPPVAGFFKEFHEGSAYYGLNIPVLRGAGATAWVQIAQNQQNPDVIVDDVAASFLERIVFVVAPVLAILLLLDIVIVRQALAPIRAASRTASSIHAANIDVRLPAADLPREAQPLVTAVNQALDRLQQAFNLQSEFIADAAHELRTPLTVLRTRTDMLSDRTVARALQVDIDAMSRIVDQLLELAELEAVQTMPDERTDLNGLCADVVAAMAPVALASGKAIGFAAAPGPVWVSGNTAMLFRAVRNLVDNAVRHTDENTTVEVQVNAAGVVAVGDSGPGVPVAERELIFQRFWRKDRKDRHHSGLGLSIVAQVARLHGAALQVDAQPVRGAVFRMIFPPLAAK